MNKAIISVILFAAVLTGCGTDRPPGGGLLISSNQTGNWEVFIFYPQSSIVHQVTHEGPFVPEDQAFGAIVEGNDFEATVDLGQLIEVKEIKASFLQDQVAWIFYPVFVEILTSSAGDEYNIIKTFIHKTKQNLTQEIKFFTTSLTDEKIRFIKIRAKSQGECPSWHPGNGGPAWIFVDEIVVQ